MIDFILDNFNVLFVIGLGLYYFYHASDISKEYHKDRYPETDYGETKDINCEDANHDN